MPNSPHLDGDAGRGHAPRAMEPSDWWEFEVALLLGQVQLTEIELGAAGAPPVRRPNDPHLT